MDTSKGGTESEHNGGQNPGVGGENPDSRGTEPAGEGDRARTIHRRIVTNPLLMKGFFRMGKLPNLSLIYY